MIKNLYHSPTIPQWQSYYQFLLNFFKLFLTFFSILLFNSSLFLFNYFFAQQCSMIHNSITLPTNLAPQTEQLPTSIDFSQDDILKITQINHMKWFRQNKYSYD